MGSEIFSEGDSVAGAYKVVSGAVRSCRYLGDGRRQVLGFYLVDEIFGLDFAAEHSWTAEAMATTTVAVTSGRATAGDEQVVDLLELATEQLAQAQHLNVDLGRKHAHERLASFFLDISRRFQRTLFTLPMPRGDVADYLGLTTESVSRIVSGFDKVGLIRIEPYARLVELVDLHRLGEIADGRLSASDLGFGSNWQLDHPRSGR